MPAVLAGVIFGAVLVEAGVPLIVAAIASSIVTYGITAAMQNQGTQPPKPIAEVEFQNRLVTTRQPISPRRKIYGELKVGGVLTFMTSTSGNTFLHMVVTLSGHPVESIEKIYLDEDELALNDGGFATNERYRLDPLISHSETHLITGSLQVTVAHPVGGVNAVYSFETNPDVPGAPIQVFWVDVSPNSPTATNQYSRTGSTFFFSIANLGQNVFIDYTEVGTTLYVRVQKSLGDEAEGTQPFPSLVTETAGLWSNDHKQVGCAKLYVRLQWHEDVFFRGVPNVSALVRGAKIFDPRTSLTVWSRNAALCVADYLADETFGIGAGYDEQDAAQLIAAANICDEDVTLAGGGTEKRYACDGIVETGQTPKNIIEQLLTSLAGFAVFSAGKWRIYPATYITPAVTLDEGDSDGPVSVATRLSGRDLCNAVKGVYTSPDNDWQPADFPAVESAAYLAEDGRRIWKDINLQFTTSGAAAQRIAKIELLRSRQQITEASGFKLGALKVLPGETVLRTFAKFGWSAKPFEVREMTLAVRDGDKGKTLGVDAVLREIHSSVFDWSTDEESPVDPAPDSNLPDPFTGLEVNDLALDSGQEQLIVAGDGSMISRILATWAAATSAFVSKYEVQHRRVGIDSQWSSNPDVMGTQTHISPVEDGLSYIVRVRARSSLGNAGPWTESQLHTVVGKTDLPPDVTGLSIQGAFVTWTPVVALDLAGYVVRYQPGLSSSWEDAVPMHQGLVTAIPWMMTTVPTGAATVMVKAVDTGGRESENAASLSFSFPGPVTRELVDETDYRTANWPGTQENCSEVADELVADAIEALMWGEGLMWEPAAELMWPAADEYATMTYTTDLAVAEAYDGSHLLLETEIEGTAWTIEYRLDGASTWNLWPGQINVVVDDYDLRVTIAGGATQGKIVQMKARVDAPQISEVLNDVAISSGGTRLALVQAYNVIRVVNLTLVQDAGTAVTAKVEDKDADLGPLIKTYDASQVAVAGTVDAQPIGY